MWFDQSGWLKRLREGVRKERRERSCNMIDSCKRIVPRLEDSDCCTVMRCSARVLRCDSVLPVHARGKVHSIVSVQCPPVWGRIQAQEWAGLTRNTTLACLDAYSILVNNDMYLPVNLFTRPLHGSCGAGLIDENFNPISCSVVS